MVPAIVPSSPKIFAAKVLRNFVMTMLKLVAGMLPKWLPALPESSRSPAGSKVLLSVKEFDPNICRKFEALLKERGFKCIGGGAFRDGFRRGGVVIKIPANEMGFQDNITEAYAYRAFRNGADPRTQAIFAPCRLLHNGCLMMVYVDRVTYGPGLPKWVDYIDAQQCGMYKGRLVAYDSGSDIAHLREKASRWAGAIGVH